MDTGSNPVTLDGVLLTEYPATHDVFCNNAANAELFQILTEVYNSTEQPEARSKLVTLLFSFLENGISHSNFLSSEVAMHKARADNLQTNFNKLTAHFMEASAEASAARAARPAGPGKKKAQDHVEKFSGDQNVQSGERQRAFRAWKNSLIYKLDEDTDDYPTEESKIKYAASRTNGSAADMSLDDILKALGAIYDVTNPVKDAEDALSTLRMGGLSWPEFYGKFCQYHAFLKYDNSSKVTQLSHKVSDDLANAVALQVSTPAPDDVTAWVHLYSTLFDNQQRLKTRNAGGNDREGNRGNTQNQTPKDPDAMEIDKINSIIQKAGGRGINRKMYNYRKNKSLCHGCGDGTHYWRSCPLRGYDGNQQRGRGRGQGRGRGDYGGWNAYNAYNNGGFNGGGWGPWQGGTNVNRGDRGGGHRNRGAHSGASAGGGFTVNHMDFGFGPVAFNPYTGQRIGGEQDRPEESSGIEEAETSSFCSMPRAEA
ncbi:uncharacterized protein BCR38DRAFT_483198 [Pseudomassariella vexata]|uniref:Uncharacterized protein n=1 Tax=Pseudomassariella vexata TaxID=1141098 RepID=A0A1Y2E7N8_9PEZI|nr:uncharacterized protein BCR38DRAFT_483198 [Pseudomassariella vexata]ORY67583.1 hypothetical protein BCR38DRAFT_483198 [Pseudomassariella vexata]